MKINLGKDLNISQLYKLAHKKNLQLAVDEGTWKKVRQFRSIVEKALAEDKIYYGINTGFGFLSNVTIAKHDLVTLQKNLIRSHACGVGSMLAPELVRGLLILRAHTFLQGYSAVSEGLIQRILMYLAYDILPLIPEKGSVGASGDLAPLAHLALGLMGEGKALYEREVGPVAEILKKLNIPHYEPKPKEGLSLINGTQFMATLGAFGIHEANILLDSADVISAVSLSAMRGSLKPFDSRIHAVRHQPQQEVVAARMRALLSGPDEIMDSHKDCKKVQDPYSFRCIPQVHGASRDGLAYVAGVFNRELSSVTDNPLVFENEEVISGGNFHGQPLAVSLDFAAILMAEIGSISERRCEKLTNPAMSDLPAFITTRGGLNSGYMIPHVVSAALVSENKILCHPSSVDSIPTSADKEDHVSMGPMAARKLRMINENISYILAIELLAACQGLDLLKPLKPAKAVQKIVDWVRARSPGMMEDRSLHEDIKTIAEGIQSGELLTVC